MTYSTGGLIQANDYNAFNGASTANVSGTLLSVYSTGKGSVGYGQTTSVPTNVAASTDTVTATQWTTLVNAINTVRKHQSGAGFTNIGTYSAGSTITATNDISGNLTAAYTNRLVYASQGVTTTGATFSPAFSAVNQLAASTFSFSRVATFASADAARYFFNAGGQLNFVIIGVTNNDGTSRSQDLATLAATNFGSKKIGGQDSVAKTGTGNATVNTDLTTNAGYWGQTTANTTMTQLTSTTASYTADVLKFYAKTNGVQGSNSDNGTTVTMSMDITSGLQTTGPFNDTINVTINHRIDVIYPETSFLANTWGSVTIS